MMTKIEYFGLKAKIIVLALILIQTFTQDFPVFAKSCNSESPTRLCKERNNVTQYIESIKKGGTDILSKKDYDENFFLCEQYTFDCGYVEKETQTISIANGIQLKMNNSEIDAILPSNPPLATEIKHYLNLTASEAKCAMKVFPLTLTAAESDIFFESYMNRLISQIKSKYLAQQMSGTLQWADININIKTALLEVIKQDDSMLYSRFWDDFKFNNFTQMSHFLKEKFTNTNQLYYLRSAYLIDSVTQRCNKSQSVSFLVDQSGSIGSAAFKLALDFLYQYVNRTFDDPKLIQIHFYDTIFENYLNFGKTKDQLLTGIKNKIYGAQMTYTGLAINDTVNKIVSANFKSGLNKILIVMTDGKSWDQVLEASNDARSKGITMIAVGIGPGVNDTQLLEIAQTPANMIKVSSYADLAKLVAFIENYFCKQIIDIKLNQTLIGNQVRVPESPAFFRLQKSLKNQTYIVKINYEENPDNTNTKIFTSQYDPFPDEFSQFQISQSYRPSIYQRVYFVFPMKQTKVRAKKDYFIPQNFSNGYLSVGGTNLKFNISLSPCNSSTCKDEIRKLKSIGSMKDISPTDGKDYNIYGIIAGSIAALACLSLVAAAALRKVAGGEDPEGNLPECDNKIEPQLTEQDLNDSDNKSDHSGRSDRKSNKDKQQKSHSDEMDSKKSDKSVSKKSLKGKKK